MRVGLSFSWDLSEGFGMFTLFAQVQAAEAVVVQDHRQLIFWGAIVLICCVPSIAYYLFKWRKTELEAELKREMIAQGMGAADIERVLNARMSPGDERHSRREMRETRAYTGES
jgi:hypothetical protein